jgi:hypothetical protein
MIRYQSNNDLFLGTSIQRTDADGDTVDCDMIVYFRVTSYSAGRPAQLYGEPGDCYPAEPAEYEFEVSRIEFDSGTIRQNQPPDDAPWPLTDAEDAMLRQWFDANYDLAWQAAVDGQADDGDDDRYDRWRDEQMEDAREYRRTAE